MPMAQYIQKWGLFISHHFMQRGWTLHRHKLLHYLVCRQWEWKQYCICFVQLPIYAISGQLCVHNSFANSEERKERAVRVPLWKLQSGSSLSRWASCSCLPRQSKGARLSTLVGAIMFFLLFVYICLYMSVIFVLFYQQERSWVLMARGY